MIGERPIEDRVIEERIPITDSEVLQRIWDRLETHMAHHRDYWQYWITWGYHKEALEFVQAAWDDSKDKFANIDLVLKRIFEESRKPIGFKRMMILQRARLFVAEIRFEAEADMADTRASRHV